jgi:hypothetical protein
VRGATLSISPPHVSHNFFTPKYISYYLSIILAICDVDGVDDDEEDGNGLIKVEAVKASPRSSQKASGGKRRRGSVLAPVPLLTVEMAISSTRREFCYAL